MPLKGYKSVCDPQQYKIVSRDNGSSREHRAVNSKRRSVNQYKIDDNSHIDIDQARCDFILMNETDMNAYLIELKGTNIDHAIEQLEATEKLFKEELLPYGLFYRIICSKAKTHKLKSNKYKRFINLHPRKNEFICKEQVYEENI